MDSQKDPSHAAPGIVFSEVRSDEPHEAVAPELLAETGAETPSHLSSASGVFNVEKAFKSQHGDEGMILKDKRRHRMSFSESLRSAFGEWLGKTQGTVSAVQDRFAPDVREDQMQIAPAETRKEIIEKAATFTAMAPKDDSKVIIAKIRTYKSDVEQLTGKPVIRPAEEKRSTWTHTDEKKPKAEISVRDAFPHAPIKEGAFIRNAAPVSPSPAPKVTTTIMPPLARTHAEEKPRITVAPIVTTAAKRGMAAQSEEAQGFSAPDIKPFGSGLKREGGIWTSASEDLRSAPPVHSQDPFRNIKDSPETASRAKLHSDVSQMLNDAGTHQKVTAEDPQTEKTAPNALETVPLRDAMPEFRSAPIPSNVKQELREFQAQTVDRPVEQKPAAAPKPSSFRRYALGGAVLGAVSVAVVMLVVGTREVLERPESIPSTEILPVFVSSFEDATPADSLMLEGDPVAFLGALAEAMIAAPQGLTEVHALVRDSGVLRTATTHEVLSYVHAQAPAGFLRSLDDHLIMGSITTSRNEPFMILRSSNFDMLFSGMLSWETRLQSDLAPIFGTPSAEPRAFTDAIRENAPARIMHDETGAELLLYTFIDQSTVVITTSSEALSALRSRM